MESLNNNWKVWWAQENNLIHLQSLSDQDEQSAQKISEEISRILKTKDEKVGLIIDLTKSGKPSSKARKILADMIKQEKLSKVATFGGGTIHRVISQFIIYVSGVKHTRIFDTEPEALAWLKEEVPI